MAHPLVEQSRTQEPIGQKIVVQNYELNPRFCRQGIWVAFGLQRALDVRQETLRDKILIYGGRLDFNIRSYHRAHRAW